MSWRRSRPLAEPAGDLQIGVRLALNGDPGELFADARALESAGAHSLWVDAADAEPYVALAALSAVTWRVRLVARGAPRSPGRAACEWLSAGRLIVAEEAASAGERWLQVELPADRDAWRALRASAAASRATGIVVPNDPRLMDLLRNPDQVFDRADLNLASG